MVSLSGRLAFLQGPLPQQRGVRAAIHRWLSTRVFRFSAPPGLDMQERAGAPLGLGCNPLIASVLSVTWSRRPPNSPPSAQHPRLLQALSPPLTVQAQSRFSGFQEAPGFPRALQVAVPSPEMCPHHSPPFPPHTCNLQATSCHSEATGPAPDGVAPAASLRVNPPVVGCAPTLVT